MEIFRSLKSRILLGLGVLILGLLATYLGSVYAFERASNSVTDIILSNIPVFDVDGIFNVGPIIFWLGAAFIMRRYLKRLPFVLESLGLLLLVRGIFITLTHIGPFPDQNIIAGNLFNIFSFGSDLFFSGHTAMPFMMALIFWDKLRLRIFFIFSSIFFAVIVLLGHMHYSIDVAAAFFITYTTFKLAEKIFKKDRALFLTSQE